MEIVPATNAEIMPTRGQLAVPGLGEEYEFLPLEKTSRVIYTVHYLIRYSNGDKFVGTYQTFFHTQNDAQTFIDTFCRKGWITSNPGTECVAQDYEIVEYARVPF